MRDLINNWRRQIRKENCPPVLAIYGASNTVLKKALELLEEHIFRSGGKDLNCHYLDGRGTKPAEWLMAARSAPMLAAQRLVQVADADNWFKKDLASGAAEAVDVLLDFASSGHRKGIIVLVAGNVDRRSKLATGLSKLEALHQFESFETKQDVHEFIRQMFRRRGISIDSAAVNYLADALGASAEAILSEVKKLSEYAGDSKVVTLADAQEMVHRLQGHELFELNRALVRKDARTALTILDRMYHNLLSTRRKISGSGLPLVILSTCIEAEFRKMAIAKGFEKTMDASGLARRLKMREGVARMILANARRFSEDEIAAALSKVREVDKRLKSTSLPSKLLLEELIISICTGGKKR